jgi:hypothetical protein
MPGGANNCNQFEGLAAPPPNLLQLARLRLARAGRDPLIEVDTVAEGDATHAGEQACCGVTGATVP